ncbi:transporter substrate-binding domain-containing protein [Oryzifoliimicrobium ureilyticus]|uniref:transporter substrate-binding domain-containing protein n=1 Tax=Oryzifoliimicrobium ureilyticus TaxID=3113724 RepID=UPI0030763AE0
MMKMLRMAMMFAVMGFSAVNTHAADQQVLDTIKKSGVLRIGTTGDYKPFTYKGPDGEFTGADIAVVKELAAHIGVKPVFVTTTWKTMLDDLRANRFDIAVGGITINPERAKVGDFSVSTGSDGKRPIARCNDSEKYTTLEAINQPSVRLIVNPGGTNEKFAHENLGKASLEIFPDNRKIFDQIAADKADVMVTDGVEVDLQSKLHPGVLCPAKVSSPFTHFEKAYLMPKNAAFKEYVDAFVADELRNGDMQKQLDAAMQ